MPLFIISGPGSASTTILGREMSWEIDLCDFYDDLE